jgi:hypothetical protein
MDRTTSERVSSGALTWIACGAADEMATETYERHGGGT